MYGSPAPSDPSGAYAAGPLPTPQGGPGAEPSCGPEGQCESADAPPPEDGDACQCRTYPCLYANVDYLQWWLRRRPAPLLLTTGDMADPIPGGLGQRRTRILHGQGFEDENGHPGARLTLGYWLDCDRTVAVEGSFFYLQQRTASIGFGTPTDAAVVLARPFINANTGREDADPVALPNVLGGAVTFTQPQRLFGGELNLRLEGPPSIFSFSIPTLLVGARYLDLDEKLIESESLLDLPGLGQPGNQFRMAEHFATQNRFYGGQLGLLFNSRFGPVILETTTKVAAGYNREEAQISAFSRVIEPDGTITTALNRALLVQPSNAGAFRRDQFSVVPEFSFNAIYEFNEYFRFRIGYTFLYESNVLRPGDQIDRVVNLQALQPLGQVGPNRPAFPFRDTDLFVQGFSVGVEFSY
ncbi:MAG: BBP7 family outer membrane beta-barrel protein [Planctomycetes bacterium]|nr:BBP7 family outer membrane beta-barrel protein [Planctomycetota bacterium]